MSTVNATTIYAGQVNTGNTSIVVGNSVSNLTITGNTTQLTLGSNLLINTTAISVGSATVNSVLKSTGLTTNSITINGTNYTAFATVSSNVISYNVFTANATWSKPAGTGSNDLVTIMAWGGGGGGNGSSTGQGGGGGACVIVNLLASQCNTQCNVVVGLGGTPGVNGGNSIFYANSTTPITITAYGGATGNASTSGGGGGWFGVGTIGVGGSPLGGASGATTTPGGASTFGGGGGTSGNYGGISVYGGGGGAQGGSSIGGNTIYGGAGGGGGATSNGGISIFGGNGANTTVAATTPGGGGSGFTPNQTGARGEVRVWVTKVK